MERYLVLSALLAGCTAAAVPYPPLSHWEGVGMWCGKHSGAMVKFAADGRFTSHRDNGCWRQDGDRICGPSARRSASQLFAGGISDTKLGLIKPLTDLDPKTRDDLFGYNLAKLPKKVHRYVEEFDGGYRVRFPKHKAQYFRTLAEAVAYSDEMWARRYSKRPRVRSQ
jgi:hypothetical protein